VKCAERKDLEVTPLTVTPLVGQVNFIYSVEKNWLNVFFLFLKLSTDRLKTETSIGHCKMELGGEGKWSRAGLCVCRHAQQCVATGMAS